MPTPPHRGPSPAGVPIVRRAASNAATGPRRAAADPPPDPGARRVLATAVPRGVRPSAERRGRRRHDRRVQVHGAARRDASTASSRAPASVSVPARAIVRAVNEAARHSIAREARGVAEASIAREAREVVEASIVREARAVAEASIARAARAVAEASIVREAREAAEASIGREARATAAASIGREARATAAASIGPAARAPAETSHDRAPGSAPVPESAVAPGPRAQGSAPVVRAPAVVAGAGAAGRLAGHFGHGLRGPAQGFRIGARPHEPAEIGRHRSPAAAHGRPGHQTLESHPLHSLDSSACREGIRGRDPQIRPPASLPIRERFLR